MRVYRQFVSFVWALLLGMGLVTAVLVSPLLALGSQPQSPSGYGAYKSGSKLYAPTDHLFINEIRIDQAGSDNDEYFELAGVPGEDLSGLTYLVIGDGSGGSGVIEAVITLSGVMPARGYFLAVEATFSLTITANLTTNLNFENDDNVTHLLVEGFSGSNGQDLDTDDDGVLDMTPWTAVHDLIAVIKEDNPPTTTEFHYGPPIVGPDGTAAPGHVHFCTGQWEIGSFTVGIDDTPGAPNNCPTADLTISKSGPLFAQAGDVITYTLTYTNAGTAVADNTSLTDTLPSNITYLADDSGLPCSSCTPGSQVLNWDLGDLPPGGSGNFLLTALLSNSVSYGAVLTNTAVITTITPESNSGNNQAQWVTTVSPLDLAVLAAGPEVNFSGQPLVYTLTVQTTGIATATQVILTDVIPLETSYVSDSAPWPLTISGHHLTWQVGDLPPGVQRTFQLTITAVPTLPNGTELTNSVTAVTGTPGDNTANNTSLIITTFYIFVVEPPVYKIYLPLVIRPAGTNRPLLHNLAKPEAAVPNY